MRIASLVPSSTEMLFALGLGESVVGVTHECDFPSEAAERPHLTRSVIPAGLGSAGIDRAVRERTDAGLALYELDEAKLAELAPELIVTQAVCEVCAVSFDDVRAAAARLPSRPEVISLDPTTLDDVLRDIPRLAGAAGVPDAGADLLRESKRRIRTVEEAVDGEPRPAVAALEWLDPLFIAGHWVPRMIEAAGGRDVLGEPGGRSRTADWHELEQSEPDVVVTMPCGYGTDQAAEETLLKRDQIRELGARVVAVDASSYFSRPGPRLVEGIELLGHTLHPDSVPAPPAGRALELDLSGPAPVG